jgi:hypothetical protein
MVCTQNQSVEWPPGFLLLSAYQINVPLISLPLPAKNSRGSYTGEIPASFSEPAARTVYSGGLFFSFFWVFSPGLCPGLRIFPRPGNPPAGAGSPER